MTEEKKSFMTEYRHSQYIPLTSYGKFFVAHKGKEFRYKGKVISKWQAYYLLKEGDELLCPELEVRDKPGWNNGQLEEFKEYVRYVYEVEY